MSWDTVWLCPICSQVNVMLDPFCKCGEWKPTPYKSGIVWIIGKKIRMLPSMDTLIVKKFHQHGALLECTYTQNDRLKAMISYSAIGEDYELCESLSDLKLKAAVPKSTPKEDPPAEDDYLLNFFQ